MMIPCFYEDYSHPRLKPIKINSSGKKRADRRKNKKIRESRRKNRLRA